jgi:dynactin complex subunit
MKIDLDCVHIYSSKLSLAVGNRVLVNGLKNGILRYIGSVEFARGLFCGVELDEPDGKHDGQVNNIRY